LLTVERSNCPQEPVLAFVSMACWRWPFDCRDSPDTCPPNERFGFFVEFAGLARKLREEKPDRARQGPSGSAPGAVGRDVDQFPVRPRLRHVELQARAARAVATDALV